MAKDKNAKKMTKEQRQTRAYQGDHYHYLGDCSPDHGFVISCKVAW